jgi:magnesium-protoporphyrin IX monomethyl ester (oxidative) cyclase
MRILLLNPAFTSPKQAGYGLSFPLGLGYLSSALKRVGHEVVGLDAAVESPPRENAPGIFRFGLSDIELAKRVEAIKPDFVGISCFFSSRFPATLETAKVIKNVDANIPIIVGGAHPSILPDRVCSHSEIDFAMIGEAEEGLVKFLEAYKKREDFGKIDGLAYKRDGHVIVNPKTNYTANLDDLGFPDWEAFGLERYLTLNKDRWGLGYGRYAPLITSRSCPYRCNFCSVHQVMGQKYRARSANNVLEEIEQLISRYGVNELSFEDDNLTYDKDRFIAICKGIVERKMHVKWNTPNGVHVGSLDREAIEWARTAGCDSLNLAIESGDEFMRNKVIKKGLNTEKIYEVVHDCQMAGIKVNAYFVIGMPGETDKSVNNTGKLIRDLHFDNLSIFAATPIPGTRLYDECLENGYIKAEQFNNDFVSEKATIFTQPAIETPQFNKQKVRLWSHRLYNTYNTSLLRHKPIIRLKSNPRSIIAIAAKICLYIILGEKLSLRVTDKIRGFLNK